MSKFLTEEWAQEVTTALNNHPGFKNAIGAAEFAIQWDIDGSPDGDVNYFISSASGTSKAALGELENPDVTVKTSYDTAVAISKGELNVQTAFMTGKVKVSGNLAKMMMHQSAIQQWAAAVSQLDVDY